MAKSEGRRVRKANAAWRGVASWAAAIFVRSRPGGLRAGKAPMAEGAVGGDGDAAPLAPGQHGMFDGALLEMIEDLVAGEAPFPLPCHRCGLFEVARVEIAHSP